MSCIVENTPDEVGELLGGEALGGEGVGNSPEESGDDVQLGAVWNGNGASFPLNADAEGDDDEADAAKVDMVVDAMETMGEMVEGAEVMGAIGSIHVLEFEWGNWGCALSTCGRRCSTFATLLLSTSLLFSFRGRSRTWFVSRAGFGSSLRELSRKT